MRERNIDWLSFLCTLTMDQTRNLGTYPDRELNPPPFGLRDNAHPMEPHRPGLYYFSYGQL